MTKISVLADKRTISGVWGDNSEEMGACVGMHGVTSIRIAPDNHGVPEDLNIVWVTVWKGDHLAARFNLRYVAEIRYADPEEPSDA